MDITQSIAMVLLVGGTIALAYAGLSAPRGLTRIRVGALVLMMKTEPQTNLPLWAGIAAIGFGVFLLLIRPG